jgi:hypothetical protein
VRLLFDVFPFLSEEVLGVKVTKTFFVVTDEEPEISLSVYSLQAFRP